ncbi:MAG: hypothetical protein H7838_03335 [Magnetococcus sp. DMHC-8]
MNISSIADFLVNQVVKTASGLQQQSRDPGSPVMIKPQRDKTLQRADTTDRVAGPSSAYRVTISSAAMQKMAMSGTTR